jgi:hypothetical protein
MRVLALLLRNLDVTSRFCCLPSGGGAGARAGVNLSSSRALLEEADIKRRCHVLTIFPFHEYSPLFLCSAVKVSGVDTLNLMRESRQ